MQGESDADSKANPRSYHIGGNDDNMEVIEL